MMRTCLWLLCGSVASAALGCVRTTLESGENHPANPNAAQTPKVETPPTLRPGFDPNGPEPAEGNQEGSGHQHHDHHHHHHHHDPGPADGGAE